MKVAIGVFAHVDAGKTTFCESLLYQTNQTKTLGRVDHGNTIMDHNELEKRRGITIFSDIASFSYSGRDYYLIDTPGHVDFSAEMERALMILDAAILLVSAPDGVQSHTMTVYRLLKERNIPVFIFINKTDQAGTDPAACLAEIRAKLHVNAYLLNAADELDGDAFAQWLCEYDDELMLRYLENEIDKPLALASVTRQIQAGNIALAVHGSALKQTGVLDMLGVVGKVMPAPHAVNETDFSARVYKVIYDAKGARVTFIKCLGGSLKVREEVLCGGLHEKVFEIRAYQGKSYTTVNAAFPGDIVGVTGLSRAVPGMGLGGCGDLPAPMLRPALKAAVLLNGNPYDTVMACLRKLEAQDPLLSVDYEPSIKEINVQIMGKIQLEILKALILERFGLDINFGECSVVYRETIAAPVMGYGHFEPLRHYAEVHLRLEPNAGGGLAYSSELHVDRLPKQYQNLIRHHVMDRDHKGVLTGSSLADIRFVLTNGAVHLEHTSGGDLREAAYRAVRQGMEKADSVLLEPYYAFFIDVDTAQAGRVLSDITRLHGVFDPPEATGARVRIAGRGPVETFLDYQTELLSFTKGAGAASFQFLGYFPCHDQKRIVEKIGYEKDRDLVNVSSSVFCSKGAGFEVKWHEAENYMHLL